MTLAQYIPNEINTIKTITNHQSLAKLKSLPMKTKDEFLYVTKTYKEVRNIRKAAVDLEKTLCQPFKDKINEIKYKIKEVTDDCDTAIRLCNQKTNVYNVQLAERQRKIEEGLRLLEEEAPIIIESPKAQSTPHTTTMTRKITTIEVIDITKVPVKYLQINEALVQKDIKLGIRNIEGLNIKEEEKTTLRIK